jgi:cysteinyl-tRNA synthetase
MLHLFNTLSRRKEPFEPLDPPRVGMYVCGPTVYGHSHLGHAKSYVGFDVILRHLRHSGFEVSYVQNITDVGHLTEQEVGMADEGEDKLVAEAKRRGLHPMALAEIFTRSYFEDMDALALLRPDISPRATGHIPEQIAMVELLLQKGCAYEVAGNVYFDTTRFPDYGKLSGRRLDSALEGARVQAREDKRHATDFALWKKAEAGHIMRWPSPWGEGYPGWHLECSVMSGKYLGRTFDIHGGGLENQFPHHECEIAQSEAAHGQLFVKYWLHNNMVTINGQKMGKSLNNFVTLKEIFAGAIEDADRAKNVSLSRAYPPEVVRFLLLQSHYRTPSDFSDEALSAALKGYQRMADCVGALRQALSTAPGGEAEAQLLEAADKARQAFTAAMDDDFNTANALSALFELVRVANSALSAGSGGEGLASLERVFGELGEGVLGLRFADGAGGGGGDEALLDGVVQLLIAIRAEARKQKDFATSDRIRDELAQKGVQLKDGPEGTTWQRAR